jgi:hypothetical protein
MQYVTTSVPPKISKSSTHPLHKVVRGFNIFKLQLFVSHNTDTVSPPLPSPRFQYGLFLNVILYPSLSLSLFSVCGGYNSALWWFWVPDPVCVCARSLSLSLFAIRNKGRWCAWQSSWLVADDSSWLGWQDRCCSLHEQQVNITESWNKSDTNRMLIDRCGRSTSTCQSYLSSHRDARVCVVCVI